MEIDYVRVYQKGEPKVGCDPEWAPTSAYIERHKDAYYNANLTLWGYTPEEGGYDATWPRNRLYPQGCTVEPSKLPGSSIAPIGRAPPFPQYEIGTNEANCVPPTPIYTTP